MGSVSTTDSDPAGILSLHTGGPDASPQPRVRTRQLLGVGCWGSLAHTALVSPFGQTDCTFGQEVCSEKMLRNEGMPRHSLPAASTLPEVCLNAGQGPSAPSQAIQEARAETAWKTLCLDIAGGAELQNTRGWVPHFHGGLSLRSPCLEVGKAESDRTPGSPTSGPAVPLLRTKGRDAPGQPFATMHNFLCTA